MVHAAPAFIGNAGVRATISGGPILNRMACRTIEPKQSCVIGWVAVTTGTRSGYACEYSTRMTALTCHTHVTAGQWEAAAVVIKIRVLPIRRVVTGGAVRAKLPVMFIILLMTRIAIGWRTLVHAILVT